MSEIKMGIREGKGHGREFPFGQGEYFQRRGGHFVAIVSGVAMCAASKTGRTGERYGWAQTPKDTSGQTYYRTSTTATEDLFVVSEADAVFELPYDGHDASIAYSIVGRGAGLLCTPLSSGNQKASIGYGPASPLKIVGVDTDNVTVRVKIKSDYVI